MLADQTLYDALNVANITDLLSTYGSDKALFSLKKLPADLDAQAESINFYLNAPANYAINYGDFDYTVNCRSDDEYTSKLIADTVKDEINRNNYTDAFITVSILSTIEPRDETDNWNTPVAVTIKTR